MEKLKLPSIKELIGANTASTPQPQQQHPVSYNETYHYRSNSTGSPSSRNSSTSITSPQLFPTLQRHSSQPQIHQVPPPPPLPASTFQPMPGATYQVVSYPIHQYSYQQNVMPPNQIINHAPIIITQSPANHPQQQFYYDQQIQHQPQQLHHQYSQTPDHTMNTKKKRPRRKANEMVRLYACNYKNCRNSYGTLNHLNAHINFKKHGPKRRPEEFKQIRELYKLNKRLSESYTHYTTQTNERPEGELKDEYQTENAPETTSEAPQGRSGHQSNSSTRSNSIADPITSLLTSSNTENSVGEEFIKNNRESIKILTHLSEKLIEEKGDESLAIFHQQRGYNGYGRYDHTLTSNDLERLPLV